MVAFFGVFGYELDPTALSEAERAEIADQVAFYAGHRELFQRGRFLRLESPFEGDRDQVAWMVVAPDRRDRVVGSYQVLSRPSPGSAPAAPARARPRRRSTAVAAGPGGDDTVARANTGERTGAELMAAGLRLDVDRFEAASLGDFRARLFVLEAGYGRSAGREPAGSALRDPSVRPRTNCFGSTR